MTVVTSLPNHPYWTIHEIMVAQRAETIAELALVALRILSRMPQPIVQVCGPISTGGAGTMEQNVARFRQAIAVLQSRGLNVFDQMPFQESMIRISKKTRESGYCWEILDEFYGPIFRSGLIKRTYFLSGWRSSIGANWERRVVRKQGIPREQFLDKWFKS